MTQRSTYCPECGVGLRVVSNNAKGTTTKTNWLHYAYCSKSTIKEIT